MRRRKLTTLLGGAARRFWPGRLAGSSEGCRSLSISTWPCRCWVCRGRNVAIEFRQANRKWQLNWSSLRPMYSRASKARR
jgi:hypothetical protein